MGGIALCMKWLGQGCGVYLSVAVPPADQLLSFRLFGDYAWTRTCPYLCPNPFHPLPPGGEKALGGACRLPVRARLLLELVHVPSGALHSLFFTWGELVGRPVGRRVGWLAPCFGLRAAVHAAHLHQTHSMNPSQLPAAGLLLEPSGQTPSMTTLVTSRNHLVGCTWA